MFLYCIYPHLKASYHFIYSIFLTILFAFSSYVFLFNPVNSRLNTPMETGR